MVNLENTVWDCSDLDDGDRNIIVFNNDHTFHYISVISSSGNQGVCWMKESDTWSVEGNKVILSFTDGYMIREAFLNESEDYMSGKLRNVKGLTGTWSARKIN